MGQEPTLLIEEDANVRSRLAHYVTSLHMFKEAQVRPPLGAQLRFELEALRAMPPRPTEQAVAEVDWDCELRRKVPIRRASLSVLGRPRSRRLSGIRLDPWLGAGSGLLPPGCSALAESCLRCVDADTRILLCLCVAATFGSADRATRGHQLRDELRALLLAQRRVARPPAAAVDNHIMAIGAPLHRNALPALIPVNLRGAGSLNLRSILGEAQAHRSMRRVEVDALAVLEYFELSP